MSVAMPTIGVRMMSTPVLSSRGATAGDERGFHPHALVKPPGNAKHAGPYRSSNLNRLVCSGLRGSGLMIVGVPSNDFGGQEPGGAAEIEQTAHQQYGVAFPLAAKAEVRGPSQHAFYRWAAAEKPLELPRWNFHKYLIGRDGHIAASFATQVEPTDARLIMAIEKELSRGA